MNVAMHAAAAVTLFLVLQSMTGSPWRSAFAAALFALHPLRVESVVWVTERKDVLSGLFFMLTLGAYVRYVRGPFSKSRYLMVMLFLAFGLMSKSMLVTLPFVLLLLDYWPLGRTQWVPPSVQGNTRALPIARLLKEKLPLFALAAASSIATMLGQPKIIDADVPYVPLMTRITNALLSYVGYIGKMLWPAKLAVWYPLHTGLSTTAVLAAAAGLAVTTIIVIREGRRWPWLVTGWFWYLGMLVPVIGLTQGNGEAMADRFTYLPSIGLTIMMCWSIRGRITERKGPEVVLGASAIVVLAICATLSRVQVGHWKDSETLFQHAVDVTHDNWLAYNNLGFTFSQEGRFREAIEQYEAALRVRPDYARAQNNLGNTLIKTGRMSEAIEHLQQAVRIEPNYALAQCNLAMALQQTGQLQEAIAHYELALQIRPDYAEAHYNLGVALEQTGDREDAIRHYQQALQVKPDSDQARSALARLQSHQ